MEMNKQPLDVVCVSGVYVAFLHRSHPRTSRCFPGTPGFVDGSAEPPSQST